MQLIASAHVVKQKDGPIPVAIQWINQRSDWGFVAKWSDLIKDRTTPRTSDSVEYAQLAEGRWQFVASQNYAPKSREDFELEVSRDDKADLGFALSLAEPEGGETYGFCFVRRTFCNHLLIEFLAASPLAEQQQIAGVGTILMLVIARLGLKWNCGEIWGECTAVSTSFYTNFNGKIRVMQGDADGVVPFSDRFVFSAVDFGVLSAHKSAPAFTFG